MKILLLGANGQLGRALAQTQSLAALGQVVLASRDGLFAGEAQALPVDMEQGHQLEGLLDQVHPDVIINAAAYTAVDRAEQEEDLATRINGDALSVIGHWAARKQALVVHYSTDYVFDGTKRTPYKVADAPNPIGAYGRSKLAGEQALTASGAPYYIFRTAWLYSACGHNFLRTMLSLAKQRSELSVVNDQYGSPTTAKLVAQGSLMAVEQWLRASRKEAPPLLGTYHLVSSGLTTWHDFAVAVFERASAAGLLQSVPQVIAVGTRDYPTPARRPAWSVLDNDDFSRRFGFLLPNWQVGLSDTINELSVKANGLTC